MNPSSQRLPGRWTVRRRGLVIALIATLALVAAVPLALLVDATWLRPLIRQHVRDHAGRSIEFTRLRIALDRELDPIVEFHGLRVENAAWAAKERPLVEAGLLRFEFSWPSLGADRVIVRRLVLADASVDLERSADGLRNWRLSDPLDRGDGKIHVQAVEVSRSTVRVVHAGRAIEVELRVEPLAATAALAAAPQLPLTKRLVFAGRHAGAPIEGDAAISDVLTFFDTGQRFALRGTARSGATSLSVEGLAADVRHLADLDVDLHLVSPRLSALEPLLPAPRWPALAFDGRAHLRKLAGRSDFTGVQARLGHSDARGSLHLDAADRTRPRPLYRADLQSAALHLGEIATLLGRDETSNGLKGLQALDADIAWRADKLVRSESPWLQGGLLDATLRDGRLAVRRFDLGVAGGHATGTLRVDSTATPPTLALDAELARLNVATFSAAVGGLLQGRAALRASGDTPAALLRTLTGSASAQLRNATISQKLDARLALDGGAWLRAVVAGGESVTVQCATLALDLDHGRGRAKRLAFETGRVALGGSGTVDLAGRTLDLTLVPHRKSSALLALDRSIRIDGTWQAPRVALADPVATPAPVRCSDRAE